MQASVASGVYAGANDLIAQALYAYRDQMQLDRMKFDRLRQDIQTGLDQLERGDCVSDFDVEQFLIEKKSRRSQEALAA